MKKYIIIALLVGVVSFVFGQGKPGEKGAFNVAAAVFNNYTTLSKVTLLDVRTAQEFEQGHIEGAVNLDYFDKGFKSELEKLDKSVPVYLYCRSGGRSSKAMQIMQEMGFVSIYNLQGGYLAWAQNK